jgi:hypothetical protein
MRGCSLPLQFFRTPGRMSRHSVWMVVIVSFAVSTADASAQTCLGRGDIDALSPAQVGVQGSAGPRQLYPPPVGYLEDATGLAGSLVVGRRYWFAGGHVGRIEYRPGLPSVLAGLTAGAQLPITRGRTVTFCPVVELNNEFGPTGAGPGQKASTRGVGGGLHVGLIAFDRGDLQVVPTAGLALNRTRMEVEYLVEPPAGAAFTYRFSSSDTAGEIALGVGLRAGRFAVTPTWTIPLATSHEIVVGAVRATRHFRSTFRLAFMVNVL